jgi:hypothetical protein
VWLPLTDLVPGSRLTLPEASPVRVAPGLRRYALRVFFASIPCLPLRFAVPPRWRSSKPSLTPAGASQQGPGGPAGHGRCGPDGPIQPASPATSSPAPPATTPVSPSAPQSPSGPRSPSPPDTAFPAAPRQAASPGPASSVTPARPRGLTKRLAERNECLARPAEHARNVDLAPQRYPRTGSHGPRRDPALRGPGNWPGNRHAEPSPRRAGPTRPPGCAPGTGSPAPPRTNLVPSTSATSDPPAPGGAAGQPLPSGPGGTMADAAAGGRSPSVPP